ncbi:MAG TPA: ABC transporter permease, partial [Thermoleophilaceae bacterium]|nr:ABC transporter permease [Thermoleophilaceae bacterium]
PLLVAMAFGLDPSPGMLLVPFIGFLTGFGFAAFGVTIAALAKSIDNSNYVTSSVITPLFLVAGAFFPLDALPGGRRRSPRPTPSTTASSWSETRCSGCAPARTYSTSACCSRSRS